MKKIFTIILALIVLILVVATGLIFDFGRGGNTNTATTTDNLPIIVFSPTDNQEVTSPIKITGKARGTWYFEAVFPIDLVNSNGDIITQHYATAETEWMTTDFVNFYSYISYPPTAKGRAILVLKKDNPSGIPDFDQSIFIPVILK